MPAIGGAQGLCWREAPKPSCSVVILTNVGLYGMAARETIAQFDPANGQVTGFARKSRIVGRATADWGLLFNVGRRDAVGFSMFGSAASTSQGDDVELGVFARYRRWLGHERSLDLALGTPLILRNSAARRSPYGLVKLNLNHWIGVALRPELRRSVDFSPPGPRRQFSTLFVSGGVELGGKPGMALSALGGIILGIVTLITISRLD